VYEKFAEVGENRSTEFPTFLPVLLLSLLLLVLLLLFIQIFSSDPSGSFVAPWVHSNYFKDIHTTVMHFKCSALELTEFLFLFRQFRNLHGFKSSGASVSAIVT
jgi:hypothetical protein